MKRKQTLDEKDRLRNNRFAAAFDELRRNHGVGTQVELARRIGVNKDTITNILNYYTPVTEDVITKLQTAFPDVFNFQWLRGESDVILAKDVKVQGGGTEMQAGQIDQMSMMNAIISAHASHISTLEDEVEKWQNESAKWETEAKKWQQECEQWKKHTERLQAVLERQGIRDPLKEYPFTIGAADKPSRQDQP